MTEQGAPDPAEGAQRSGAAHSHSLPEPTGTRVRVSAPDGSLPPVRRSSSPAPADTFYVRSLIRTQLRLAASVALGFLLVLVGLAVLIATWPAINEIRLITIPLPWWLLGAGVYPLILLCAFLFNQAAARNEAKYKSIAK